MFFIASLTCLSSVLAWRFAPPWCAPFLALCLTALVHLLAAMSGFYHEGRILLAILSVVLCLFVGFSLRKNISCGRYIHLAIPSLLFSLLLLLLSWHYAEARLVYWDEFYWGGFVKHLVLENKLWSWNSVLPRHDSVLLYPPIVTILQALFQPIDGFSESAIALGEAAVLLSATGVVIHLAREQGIFSWSLSLCALCTFGILRSLGIPVRYFSYLFGYAEGLQTCLFVIPILSLLYSNNMRLRRSILLFGLPVLTLCKITGFLLTLSVLGITALNTFLRAPSGEKVRQGLREIILPGGVCVLFYGLWYCYLQLHILHNLPHLIDDITNIVNYSTISLVIKQYIYAFFIKGLISIPYLRRIDIITSTIIFLFFSIYSYKKINNIQYYSFLFLLFEFFIWILVHLYATITYMTPEEQAYAASYERYIAVATSPFIIAFCISILKYNIEYNPLITKNISKICTIMLCLVISTFFFIRPAGLPHDISEIEEAALIIKKMTQPGSKYWLIVGKERYIYRNACQFYLMPDRQEALVSENIRFNPHNTPETALLGGKLPDDLRIIAQKNKVDYILLWNVPDNFIVQYGNHLGLNNDTSFPILLKIDTWRTGECEFPEKIFLSKKQK